jgi:hypothetical protein
MRVRFATLPFLLAACSGDHHVPNAPPPAPAAQDPAATRPPLLLEHDFGVIPHGEKRVHEWPLDLSKLPEPSVPLRVHISCSCGHADLRLRKPDGTERFVDISGLPRNLPQGDETLFLHVEIDSTDREALDIPHTKSDGYVVLQPLTDDNGSQRFQWPFSVRFGVDSPVTLTPFAAIDFANVPLSQTPELVTGLAGDEGHPGVTFGTVTSTDPAITASLATKDGLSVLRVRCQPGEPGNHRAALSIATSLPGYTLRVPVTWKVVPDLQATPMRKVSVSAPLAGAQTVEEASHRGQYVLVIDHDPRRSAEFAVHRIVGDDGRDLAPHFRVHFQPIPEQPRQHRLLVCYQGGLATGIRGEIVLTKAGDAGPFLPIELVYLPTKAP